MASNLPSCQAPTIKRKGAGEVQTRKLAPDLNPLIAPSDDRLLIAAMDFGTTYSGYAFAFRDSPMDIKINQHWIAGSRSLISMKTPTCILLTPEQNFFAFGYQAEDKYSELAFDEKHTNWFFFKRFKMLLHQTTSLNRNTELLDVRGKPVQAMKIFSLAIESLRKHLMTTLHDRATGITEDDVKFLLTVPAIWTDSSKQFMREAAEKAGIPRDRLTIVLEPEAASVYCQYIPVEVDSSLTGSQLSPMKPGTQYMVLDLGGGTADVTVHEKQENGTLRELHSATGGPWGGIAVDGAFLQFLRDLLGDKAMDDFCSETTDAMLDLMREFETRKRTVSCNMESMLTITVPPSLLEHYSEHKTVDIETKISDSKYAGKIRWKRDKLRLHETVVRSLFEPTIQKVLSHVESLLQDPKLKDVQTILMVGGFSACELVKQAFRDKFPAKTILIPAEPEVVVLKGAVIGGFNPEAISSRICRYTYGVLLTPPFDSSKHSVAKRMTVDGRDICVEVFKIYVHAGQEVQVGHAVKSRYETVTENQDAIENIFYISDKESPEYTTDEGCRLLGTMRVCLPEAHRGLKRRIEETVIFGGTELMVEAKDSMTGQITKTVFDFLV